MRKRLFRCSVVAMALGWALMAADADAQALDPADYVPAKPGTNVGLVYTQYAHASSEWKDGHKVNGDAGLDSIVTIFRYVRFGSIAGMVTDYQILQPYAHLRGTGSTRNLGEANGFGDTILCATLWVLNDPQSRSYLGITPFVFLPTGEYDRTRALNPGEHRWKGSMQVVYSKGVLPKFALEGSADVMFYSNDRQAGPKDVLSQKPMARFQGFARYEIAPRDELAVRAMYLTGGKTRLSGIDQDNQTGTVSLLTSWRHLLPSNFNVMIQAGRDVSVENGFKEAARVQLRLAKVF